MTSQANLSSVLGQLPVLGVDKIVRRTLVTAAFGCVAVACVAIGLGYLLVVPGLIIGYGMAVLNHRVFQSSALRFSDTEGTLRRKPFAGSVLVRLGVCTLVAIGLLLVVQPMGWGAIAALAIFQGAMLINAVLALIGYQKSGGELG